MPPSCAVHLPNTSLYLPTCLDGGQKFISEGFNQDLKDVSKGFIIRNPTIKSSMSVCLIVSPSVVSPSVIFCLSVTSNGQTEN